MPESLLVGLDIGTSSAKAVVFTPSGDEVAVGQYPTRWQTGPGRAEMTADGLLTTAYEALGRALSQADGRVAGIGVTGMGEAGVVVDRAGRPVAPVIAWHDERDGAEVIELDAELGDEFGEMTGLPLRRQWTLTKFRWLRRHLTIPRDVRFFSVGEWVVRGLGGVEVSDYSLASRTGWLNMASGDWWPAGIEFSGIPQASMPQLVMPGERLGTANSTLPSARGAVLTTAGQDHQAAALGAGAVGTHDVLDSSGTAEALVRTVEAGLRPTDIRSLSATGTTVGRHVIAGHWCLLAATEGGLALSRVQSLLGVDRSTLATLDEQALAATRTAGLEVTGVGEPSLTITGIGDFVSPADLWAVTADSVTAEAAGLLEQMEAVVGPRRRLVVTGGWAHSEAVLAAKLRHFGSFERSSEGEPGARGAALLAGVAADVLDAPEGVPSWRTKEVAQQ